MPFQLFGGKDEFLVRGRLVGLGIIGIIVGMDYELAVYGDRLIFRVVKVKIAVFGTNQMWEIDDRHNKHKFQSGYS